MSVHNESDYHQEVFCLRKMNNIVRNIFNQIISKSSPRWFCWGKVNVCPELLPFFTWIQRIVLISSLRTWKLVNLKNLQKLKITTGELSPALMTHPIWRILEAKKIQWAYGDEEPILIDWGIQLILIYESLKTDKFLPD